MALTNLITDKLNELNEVFRTTGELPEKPPGEFLAEMITDLLKDNAVRAEVYEESRWNVTSEGFSIADVHAVLDGLIRVFEDEAVQPVEEISEVETVVNILTE